jgi:hypothetical protein
MSSIFRRRRAEVRKDPENRPDQRLLRTFLPASARPYDTQRLHVAYANDGADPDGPDEDIEFLASLVEEIERAPAPLEPDARTPAHADEAPAPLHPARRPAVTAPAITVRVTTDDEHNLNVFRAIRAEPERSRTSQDLGVRDVAMDDLLEDLATTAAAIRAAAMRRRKAA